MSKFAYLMLILMSFNMAACTSVAASSESEVEVKEMWGRPLPASVSNGSFYLHIVNHSDKDEQLLTVDSEFCPQAEIHNTTIDDKGVMHMEMVAGGKLSIPAHEEIVMKPGGLHLMCLGKTAALEIGDEISFVFTFAQAGNVTVTAVIRDEPMEHMDH